MSCLLINSIMENPSLCDGYGYRTVLLLQGCDIRCEGCQNRSTWDISKGKKVEVEKIALEIRTKCKNKKLTISGGLGQERGCPRGIMLYCRHGSE